MSKKESYPPLDVLKLITRDYPRAWEQMEMFHQKNGQGNLPSWPEWCYAPVTVALAVASKGYNISELPIEMQAAMTSLAQGMFALAPWRLSKEVYVIDPDLKDLLFEQNEELDIPNEILLQLPYPCFYVEIPDTYFRGDKIHGFWVTLEYDPANGDRELKPVFLTDTLDILSFSIHIGCKTIAESVNLLNKQSLKAANSKEIKEMALVGLKEADETKAFLKKILQVILYILAQNAEITPNQEQNTVTKRGQTIKDKYSEIRKWDVGVRIGTAIRQQKIKEKTADVPKQKDTAHQSPRPHMRRGHWHHFWTGPKANPEKRKLILKWLSPMAISANPDDTPVVFHEVE